MDMTILIVVLFFLPFFILAWVAICAIIGAEHGWRAALRIAALGLPILIILGALSYGFFSLPKAIQEGFASAIQVLSIFVGLYGIITHLLVAFRGGELWVDSKPATFIDTGGMRFNAPQLIFALFALIPAWESGAEFLESGPDARQELLSALSYLSLAIVGTILAFRRFQIRETGIVTAFGCLIRWTSISSYKWIEFRDIVILTLNRNRSRKVTVPYELRTVVEKHLEQQVGLPRS